MALLEEIGGKLTALGLCSSSGAGGWVLIKSWMPDSTTMPHKMVALSETGGMAPALSVELDYPSFQVRVRGDVAPASTSAYVDARAEAESIKLALHGLGGVMLPSSSVAGARYYVQVAAMQEPALMQYDGAQRPVIVCNFRATRSRT